MGPALMGQPEDSYLLKRKDRTAVRSGSFSRGMEISPDSFSDPPVLLSISPVVASTQLLDALNTCSRPPRDRLRPLPLVSLLPIQADAPLQFSFTF